MKYSQRINSAVLYFVPGQPIPLAWYVRAVSFFSEHGLSPILFTASGGANFQPDDCYVLNEQGRDLLLWNEPIQARREDLVDELRRDVIESLSLDVPRSDAQSRPDWRVSATASSMFGQLFIGVDEAISISLSFILRWLYSTSGGLFDIRYAFAFTMPLADDPEGYARGSRPFRFSEFQEESRLRSQGIPRKATTDELWAYELQHGKRHLTGLFRGAYPINVLSDAHVRTARLDSEPIGRLSPLEKGHWLWELNDAELRGAKAALHARGALVSQAARS